MTPTDWNSVKRLSWPGSTRLSWPGSTRLSDLVRQGSPWPGSRRSDTRRRIGQRRRLRRSGRRSSTLIGAWNDGRPRWSFWLDYNFLRQDVWACWDCLRGAHWRLQELSIGRSLDVVELSAAFRGWMVARPDWDGLNVSTDVWIFRQTSELAETICTDLSAPAHHLPASYQLGEYLLTKTTTLVPITLVPL